MTSPRLRRNTALITLIALLASLGISSASADYRGKESAQESAQGASQEPSEDSSTGADCAPLLAAATQGSKAKIDLGSSLGEAAKRNGESEADFSARLDDETHWVDTCGLSFYVEPTATAIDAAQSKSKNENEKKQKNPGPVPGPVPGPLPFDYSTTFLLHSRAGAPVTIYLDFTGHIISQTAWNATYTGGADWTALGYSLDADYSTFTTVEMDNVYAIWQQVSEDYAAMNVDVTTQVPAAGVLERTDTTDTTYGTRVLISDDPIISTPCACGGLSYVGVIDYPGTNHEYYQPAWVFSKALGYKNKYVAEAAAHEAGHTLGLAHDGTTTPATAYYAGSSGWAPIMGVGYYQPVVQWSKGEYPSANNLQDDFAVMATHGATLVADEDLNTSASARPAWVGVAANGVISSAKDSDWYRIIPSATGAFTASINPSYVGPNLDIQANLYAADGKTLITSSNPALAVVSSEVANGLNALISSTLTAGQSYYLSIAGSGSGALTSGGYSTYGSVGRYSITLSGPVGPLTMIAPSNQSLTVGTATSIQLYATGGAAPYTWSATTLPTGLSISTSGVISGTPTTAGTTSVTVTATDKVGTQVSSTFTITVISPLVVLTKTLPLGVNGVSYSTLVTASGGTAPYVWSATKLPTWATINSSTGVISGTPNAVASTSIIVTATDSAAAKISQTLTLQVVSPVSITTSSVTAPTRLKAYKFTFAASGGSATKTWSLLSGTLPAGITLSSAGVLSGTTSVAKGSSYTFTVRVTDGNSSSQKTFSFTTL